MHIYGRKDCRNEVGGYMKRERQKIPGEDVWAEQVEPGVGATPGLV
jgi:hypothetical protein